MRSKPLQSIEDSSLHTKQKLEIKMKNLVKSVAFGALLSIGLTACGGGRRIVRSLLPLAGRTGGAVSDDNGTVYAVMSNVNIGQEYALSPSNGEMWVEVPLQKEIPLKFVWKIHNTGVPMG